MKNKHTEDDEKIPLWFEIMMWTIVIIAIIGIIFVLDYFLSKTIPDSVRCTDECNKFDMKYYKTDRIYNTPICWCLDNEGKPKSIGGV